MVKVEQGQITQTSLPKHGYIDGKFVSTLSKVPIATLKTNGWYQPEHEYPEYDSAYEKLSTPTYTYNADTDTVTATYTVIDKPEAILTKKLDEQQIIIADLVEELLDTQFLLADLTEEVLMA